MKGRVGVTMSCGEGGWTGGGAGVEAMRGGQSKGESRDSSSEISWYRSEVSGLMYAEDCGLA